MKVIRKSSYFEVKVEEPEDDYDHGLIILSFTTPRVNFGFVSDYRYSGLPKEEQRKVALREMIQSFTDMIQKELRYAIQDLDAKEKK
jgi:hypothetical protein